MLHFLTNAKKEAKEPEGNELRIFFLKLIHLASYAGVFSVVTQRSSLKTRA